jgi:hypothetical protein
MTVTADALDLLAQGGAPSRLPGDFQRNHQGAPYVNHPTETTKDGRPKRVLYGRPSSFGGALDSPYSLLRWKERQLLIGAMEIEHIFGHTFGADEPISPDDRDALDRLAARCHEAAGSSLAADRGTHVHLLLEHNDRGGIPHDLLLEGERLGIPIALQAKIVADWEAFRTRLGVTAVGIEQTVVNDRWRLAGTLDRLDVPERDILTAYGVLAAGEAFVGDIKTGSLTLGNDGQPNYWVKFGVQLAAYVDAVPYDTETDEREDWP